jgi:hypothetical protein
MTTPNQLDYLNFLFDEVGVDSNNLVTYTGVATSGTTTMLEDGSVDWAVGQWVGNYCYDLTQGISSVISSSDETTVTFPVPLDNPILANDDYLLSPSLVNSTLNIGMSVVNDLIACIDATLYTRAVYNLGTHYLISLFQDYRGQRYWKDLRKSFNLDTARLGVVASSSNDSSSTSYLNPEQFRHLTLRDLQLMKTPWGREYLGIAQDVGYTAYGIT